MKYFEFGKEADPLAVILHGGGTSYSGAGPTARLSCLFIGSSCFILITRRFSISPCSFSPYNSTVIIPARIAESAAKPTVPINHLTNLSFCLMYGRKSSVPGITHASVCPTQ